MLPRSFINSAILPDYRLSSPFGRTSAIYVETIVETFPAGVLIKPIRFCTLKTHIRVNEGIPNGQDLSNLNGKRQK